MKVQLHHFLIATISLSLLGSTVSQQFDYATGLDVPCFEGTNYTKCYPCSISGPTHCPAKPSKLRVRREIRDLTPQQWQDFAFAMNEMRYNNMTEGIAKYGSQFKTFTYMSGKHAVSSHSRRGDQAHFGAWFMSYHSAFVMEYEESIMAIVHGSNATGERQLEGMPYWWNLDMKAQEVLSPEYFGTHPGLGEDYQVNDGAFANWTIARFEEFRAEYEQYIADPADNGFWGSPYGYVRSENNWNDSPNYVAYPQKDGSAYQGYNYSLVEPCMNATYHPTEFNLVNFTSCIDMIVDPVTGNRSVMWHGDSHFLLGNQGFPDSPWFQPQYNNSWGDFRDVETSANAPVFPTYHATVDMFIREWLSKAGEEGARQLWGLPYQNSSSYLPAYWTLYGKSYDGVDGGDVVSSGFPYKYADLGWAKPEDATADQLLTHAESHCCFAKENAPYVYAKYSKAPAGAPGQDIVNPYAALATEAGPTPQADSEGATDGVPATTGGGGDATGTSDSNLRGNASAAPSGFLGTSSTAVLCLLAVSSLFL